MMIRAALYNLYLTLVALAYGIVHRIPGWKYPLTHQIDQGDTFHTHGSSMELFAFNRLKHAKQLTLLSWVNAPLVLVTTFQGNIMYVTAFRLVKDIGQTDIAVATRGVQGKDGRFFYHYTNGQLQRALRPTGKSRHMGFLPNDPLFTVVEPLTDRDRAAIDNYRDKADGPLLPDVGPETIISH